MKIYTLSRKRNKSQINPKNKNGLNFVHFTQSYKCSVIKKIKNMNKLIMAFLVLATISMSAQRGPRGGEDRKGKDLTVEQMATLKTKKMTLALALDNNQSKKVYNVLLAQAKDRKQAMEARKTQTEKPELTKEQKFAKTNERLDKQIAMQQEMQSILSEDQFKQFKKMSAKRKGEGRRGGKRGRGQRGK